MQSRARLLLEKELFKLQKHKVWGIDTKPLNDDDLFIWEATIKGPKDTLWEGGIFKLYLQFDEGFNDIPPKVYFHTIPFHPNVDPVTGIPCLDFLDDYDQWKEYYSLNYILLSIQMMLSNPVLKDAVNADAAQMYRSSPGAYRQLVLDSVLASKRVDAGLQPHFTDNGDLTRAQKQPQSLEEGRKRSQKVAKVSFEDYFSMWSGMATTKPAPKSKNPLSDILRTDSKLQAAHFGLQQHELQEEIRKQITEHNALMYGKFQGPKGEDLDDLKAQRIQLLKQVYLPKNPDRLVDQSAVAPSTPSISASMSASDAVRDIEPSDHEVEELLAWSSNLKLHEGASAEA
ncbi:ubiquitin-conjugating enzyme E2 U [Nematostella vectensis]|uniref:ubiquitin-conjugating enzyme E2 U n=1 Tax=Nematostella vectensis TaxID=45351 RepID=UPI002076E656|nr:ubiquitin-conjugating enzyme E2 U [Nematostella vectensis]